MSSETPHLVVRALLRRVGAVERRPAAPRPPAPRPRRPAASLAGRGAAAARRRRARPPSSGGAVRRPGADAAVGPQCAAALRVPLRQRLLGHVHQRAAVRLRPRLLRAAGAHRARPGASRRRDRRRGETRGLPRPLVPRPRAPALPVGFAPPAPLRCPAGAAAHETRGASRRADRSGTRGPPRRLVRARLLPALPGRAARLRGPERLLRRRRPHLVARGALRAVQPAAGGAAQPRLLPEQLRGLPEGAGGARAVPAVSLRGDAGRLGGRTRRHPSSGSGLCGVTKSPTAPPGGPATSGNDASGGNLGFIHGFAASFSVIIVSELGDKTFFIAAIMAMRYNRLTVLAGAILALSLMTCLSVLFGYATTIIPRIYTYYVSTALFAIFGVRMLREGLKMSADEGQEELEEVQAEIKKKDEELQRAKLVNGAADVEAASGSLRPQRAWHSFISPIFVQAFTLTFLAEWGDRSQLTTIVLAAREDPFGVAVGGTLGHWLCTGLAVVGGRMVAQKISVRTVTIIGGVVFLAFAFSALFIKPDTGF
ncbi:putative divalent cation/proton antiporter TMEM165 isoform X1 [Scleropages formosus]|uniref:putative divalent cation/proton antiporter TMEM165 isoform X1 n=1 Tax=Scleropages formosus TaxID=113540 RepID=UPI0010FA9E84|nr:transmembrane protein 165 isoform X1 [Scleropages formosus]